GSTEGVDVATVFKPTKRARKWYIEWTDESGRRRKRAGCADKAATERIARDLENRVALRKAGLVDPRAEAYPDHGAKPLSELLAAWQESLEAKGSKPKSVGLAVGRARRVVAVLLGAKLSEVDSRQHADKGEVARAEANLSRALGPARLSDLTAE